MPRTMTYVSALLVAGSAATAELQAQSQGLDADMAARMAQSAASPTGAEPASKFGRELSAAEAGSLLSEMRQITEEAIEASLTAERAATVAEVKGAADRVHQAVWGIASDVLAGSDVEVASLGWKERWQVSGAEFDSDFVERYGSDAPAVTDPRELGIAGRGRAVRGKLMAIAAPDGGATGAERAAAEATISSLNNVIGWTYITVGFKGREVQPRISLTHVWDAPTSFWNSSADTGWLYEAQAQAINILKTSYDDVEEARQHAADMTLLLVKVLEGVDVNGNGAIESVPMEGGLRTALLEAAKAGLRVN